MARYGQNYNQNRDSDYGYGGRDYGNLDFLLLDGHRDKPAG